LELSLELTLELSLELTLELSLELTLELIRFDSHRHRIVSKHVSWVWVVAIDLIIFAGDDEAVGAV